MAEVVDKLPSWKGSPGKKGSQYDRFFDGRAWKLISGEDFEEGETERERAKVITVARRRKLRVKTRTDREGNLYIQLQNADTPAASREISELSRAAANHCRKGQS